MYRIDIKSKKSGAIEELHPKGGIDMKGKIFKSVRLDYNSYAFFTNQFDHFYIFKVFEVEFTKINIILFQPLPRDNYTLHRLSDGRIVFMGGANKETCFHDAFYLMEYSYENGKEVQYGWNSIDVFGVIGSNEENNHVNVTSNNGYFGHASILLENDNILIHGGTQMEYDYINILIDLKLNNVNPIYTNRFKLLDISNSYKFRQIHNSNILNS